MKKIYSFLGAAALLLAGALSTQAQTAERVPYVTSFDNTYQEYDRTSYLPKGWMMTGDNPFYTANMNELPAVTGKYYIVSQNNTQAPRNEHVYTPTFALEGGKTYEVSYQLYMPGYDYAFLNSAGKYDTAFHHPDHRLTYGEEQDYEFHELHDALYTIRGGERQQDKFSDTWETLKVNFTPAESGNYCLCLAFESNGTHYGDIAVDDFSISYDGAVLRPTVDFAYNGYGNLFSSNSISFLGRGIDFKSFTTHADAVEWVVVNDMDQSLVCHSNEANITVDFPQNGNYTVMLRASNSEFLETAVKKINVDFVGTDGAGQIVMYNYPEAVTTQYEANFSPVIGLDDPQDFCTGPNHTYRHFAERFDNPENVTLTLNTLQYFENQCAFASRYSGSVKNEPFTFAIYGEKNGELDESNCIWKTTVTMGDAFVTGTNGLGGATQISRSLEGVKVSGPFYIAFEFDEAVEIDPLGGGARHVIELRPCTHADKVTTLHYKDSKTGQWHPLDYFHPALAGTGLVATLWAKAEVTDPNAITNGISVADAKAVKISSSNRNDEYTLTEELLVTGTFGPSVFVEANGVGMQLNGLTGVNKGDIITNVAGTLAKVSYAKNAFNANEFTLVSSGNEVTPVSVTKEELAAQMESLDARLVSVADVTFDAAAATDGVFNMTVTPAQTDLGISVSMPAGTEYASPAIVTGFPVFSTMGAAMASLKAVSVEAAGITNGISVADAKAVKISSSNRNDEYTLTEELLVTGTFGPSVFVEANGVGMQLNGLTGVNKGDIITNVAGTLAKVSYAKNAFNATEFTLVSSGNEVTPVSVTKEELAAQMESLDARLVSVADVTFDAAAATDGVFNMTVTAAHTDLGISVSMPAGTEYASPAIVTGFPVFSTMGAAMASLKAVSVEAAGITNGISVADAKAVKISSSNRNDEYTLTEELLVTGTFGPSVFVEANGVGMQLNGLTGVNKGDIITNVAGTLAKVSYAKNAFNATEFTLVSSGNEVTPVSVTKEELAAEMESLDARLVSVADVTFEAAAATDGVFNMTVTAAQTDLDISVSMPAGTEYASPAIVTGFPVFSTMGAAMASLKAVSVEAAGITNGISVADAKAVKISSSNRNDEYTLTEELLVTGTFGPSVFVEANGVGMQLNGLTGVNKGDIITNVAGTLAKVSYAKNAFNATEFTLVSSGNEVTPVSVTKEELAAQMESLDARLVSVADVTFDAAAATDGVFNMTVTAAQTDLDISVSMPAGTEYASPAIVTGFPVFSTMGAMASLKAVSVEADLSGISSIMSDSSIVKIYDMSGRRVAMPESGKVYIMNGKKVMK